MAEHMHSVALSEAGGVVVDTATVGLNLMGNTPMQNIFESVQADTAVLGLLPGCFTGHIQRAFTLCVDDAERDTAELAGKMFLGRPQIPLDAWIQDAAVVADG
eukprot:Skav205475  [mRNA]  locus=scaffold830:82317:84813:+ [translate_table: standard]